MKKNTIQLIWPITLLSIALGGCDRFLDIKPDKSLVTPTKLVDLQALFDSESTTNFYLAGLGEASSDNYYITDDQWNGLDQALRQTYVWGDEIQYSYWANPWLNLYSAVYTANFVLESLEKFDKAENIDEWNDLKGQALFHRGYTFFKIASVWAQAFDGETAAQDMGIPLRLSSDFNEPTNRSSLQQTYNQLLTDVTQSIGYLPLRPINKLRPSKHAAYALLSRIYLAMRDYPSAEAYADSSLHIDRTLMDFNDLDTNSNNPIARFNDEIIFAMGNNHHLTLPSRARVDTVLLSLFDANDLRRPIYFRLNSDSITYRFKGSYMDSYVVFQGLANDEILLNKAECMARSGHSEEALKILNRLLLNRFKQGAFDGIDDVEENEVLNIILEERRKELVFRDLRWTDIKRLNKEPGREVFLQRMINGEIDRLLPNENRYALPIPADIIDITGIPQNPR